MFINIFGYVILNNVTMLEQRSCCERNTGKRFITTLDRIKVGTKPQPMFQKLLLYYNYI